MQPQSDLNATMSPLLPPLESISIGLYEKALPLDMSWPDRFLAARQAGYDFLEIAIDDTDERIARLDWTPAERAELRKAILETGLPLRSMSLSAHRRFPLGALAGATRQKGLNILYKAIDFATELGLRYILVAGIDVYYEESNQRTRAFYLEGLERGFQRASSSGVMLALENWDIGIHSIQHAMEYLRHFNSPWFQLYVDIGNLNYAGHNVVSELEAARGHIAAVHLKDTLQGQLRYVPLGEGTVPFVQAFAKLAAMGFQGPACVELWTEGFPDAVKIVTDSRKWITEQMELGWQSSCGKENTRIR